MCMFIILRPVSWVPFTHDPLCAVNNPLGVFFVHLIIVLRYCCLLRLFVSVIGTYLHVPMQKCRICSIFGILQYSIVIVLSISTCPAVAFFEISSGCPHDPCLIRCWSVYVRPAVSRTYFLLI
jgi:hypothetical protein